MLVSTPCQDLTRPFVCPAALGSHADVMRHAGVVHHVRRRRRRGQAEARPRRAHRRDRASSARRAPRSRACARSTARRRPVVHGHARARDLEMLRLRPGRGHLQLRHGARRRSTSRPRCVAGRSRRRRDQRAHHAARTPSRKRLRDALEAAIAFYHRVLTDHAAGPAGARLPARPRLHRRDHRSASSSGCAPDAWDALTTALDRQARHHRGGPGGAPASSVDASGRPRRLRPLPRPGHLPDPRRVGQRHRPRRPRRSGSAPSPAATRDPSTSTRRPRCCSTRAARCTSSTRPSPPSGRRAAAVLVEGNTDALMAHQQGFDNVVGSWARR